MQQFSYEYILSVDYVGFAANVSGPDWILTTNEIPDDLAHTVVILSNNGNSYPGETILLSGLDADRNPQTEIIDIPGDYIGNISTKYFSTLESAVPSVSTGEMSLGWTAESVSKTIALDWRSNGLTQIITDPNSVIYLIEETFANIYDAYPSTLPWGNVPGFIDYTDHPFSGNSTVGSNSVRVHIADGNNGASLSIKIHEPGPPVF